MERWLAYPWVLVLLAAWSGCAPSAQIRLEQPAFQGLQRSMNLYSRWAVFDDSPQITRYLFSFPLPGATSGDEHYHLFVQTAGDEGVFAAGSGNPQARRCYGFFIQLKGPGAGLTELKLATMTVKNGKKARQVDLQAVCDDGSRINGTFRASRDRHAMRRFGKRYAADIEALMLSGEAEKESRDAPDSVP